jgi:hypothetical protein
MKNALRILLTGFILLMNFIPSVQAQRAEWLNQVIIVNGGKFETTPPYQDYVTVESYKPDTQTTIIFDTIYTQSAQDVVIRGNFAYVAAQDSIIMYNLDTYERVAVVGDSGVSRLGIYKGNLIVTKQYPIKRFFAEVLNGNSLALLARVQNISGECGGVTTAGDSLYIAVNYGYLGTEANIAVLDPNNYSLVREIELGDTAVGLNDLYCTGGYVWGIASTPYGAGTIGAVIRYNYITGEVKKDLLGYLIGRGAGVFGDYLYMMMNYAVGSFNLLTETVDNPAVLPDPGSLNHIFYSAVRIDYVNQNFYANITNQLSFGIGWIATLTGDSLTTYPTGINADALAMDYRTPVGIADSRDNEEMFSVFPNPVTGLLKISLKPGTTVTEIRVADITGRTILSASVSAGTEKSSIDLTGYPTGIYFVTVISSQGTQTRKIVKN